MGESDGRAVSRALLDMPPDQTMRCGAANSVTLSAKARPGEDFVCTVTFPPDSMRPSTRVTVLFHFG